MRSVSASLLSAFVFALALGSSGANAQHTESNVQKRNVGGKLVQSEREEQEALFNYYFQDQEFTYETKLDKLKKDASVPAWRIPYSAAIHSQQQGGLSDAGGRGGLFRARGGGSSTLNLYDRAFGDSRGSANSYEVRRVMGTDRAVFPGLRMRRASQPWEGYCSGLTASAIRHPEPMRAVDAGQFGGAAGVVFQPSDIKALLTCIYNRTTDDSYLYLAPPSARDGGPNMGTFHLALANYIGQAGCPIGIDRTKGEVSWNNPIYSYEVNSIQDAGESDGLHYKNLSTTITYSFYGSDQHTQTDPETGARQGNVTQSMAIRYTLAVDDKGEIVGGRAITDSGHFLWIPLYAPQATVDGKVQGNPYISVRKVIAMARASALPEVQKKYDAAVIGPQFDPSTMTPEEKAAEAKAAAEKAAAEKAAEEKAAAEEAAAMKAAEKKAAQEKAAKEKAAAKKAADKKAADEKAAKEKAAAKKAAEKKAADEKAAADKAAAKKAADEKAAAEKAAAKKPAATPPAKKPAADTPAKKTPDAPAKKDS